MSQVELEYEKLKQEFIKSLEGLGSEDVGSERGVISTSMDDHVTARRMRLLSDELTMYGWTNRDSRKAKQISVNPHVSVVIEYIQIDGLASIEGHPLDESKFLEIIHKKLPHRYEALVKNWSTASNRVVLKVLPKRVALFKYADPVADIASGLYVLDVDKRKAYRQEYS